MNDDLANHIVELEAELTAANAVIVRLGTQNQRLRTTIKDLRDLLDAVETYCETNHERHN